MSVLVCRASRMRLRDAFIVLTCCLIVSGNPRAADEIFHLDIAPGALTSALDALAHQTHLEFIYSSTELAGFKTRGVRGDLGVPDAVEKLVAGTGLVVKAHASGAILITSAPRPSPSADERPTLHARSSPEEEVLVTASRRAEPLSRVAGGVSVVSGKQLEELGAHELADYVSFLPGVGTQSFGHPGYESTFMRGVAAQSVGATISTYIDEVPVTPSSSLTRGGLFTQDLDPSDLARIEAVKGPQGTLYGASSMGGVIKYVTRNPDLSHPEFRLYQDFNLPEDGSAGLTLRATGSLPLIQNTLAVRLGGFYRHVGGYIDDVGVAASDINRANERGFRAKLLYQPFDALSLKITAMSQSQYFHGNNVVDYDLSTGSPVFGASSQFRYAGEPSRTELQLYSAELEYRLTRFDLIAASSYSTARPRTVTDLTPLFRLGGLFPAGSDTVATATADEPSSKLTQEIRLVAPRRGSLEWMLGGFFQRENLDRASVIVEYDADGRATTPFFDEGHSAGTLVERAGFANATAYLTEDFDITAGVRLSNIDQTLNSRKTGVLSNPADPLAEIVRHESFSETPVTWLAVARWRPSTDASFYARAASGYRPGGARAVPPGSPPGFAGHYESDSIWSYEAGLKLQTLRERLDLDLAGFWIDWARIQSLVPAGDFVVDGNGGSAHSRGFELQAQYSSPVGFDILANCAFTDAKFTESIPAAGVTAGDPLHFIPRWTATLAPSYSRAIAQGSRLELASDLQYQGKRLDIAGTSLPASWIWNARVAWSDDRFRVSFYVRNITNEQALLGFGEPGLPTQYGFVVNAPRTIGVAFTQDLTGAR